MLTVIDKKANFINGKDGEIRKIIWREDIQMNKDIDETWCLENYFKKKGEKIEENDEETLEKIENETEKLKSC